jgi:dTDP-4-dehydrorhamnose 3,5-epimerase
MGVIQVSPTRLEGLSVLHRNPFSDHRGSFERLFCDEDLAQFDFTICQINLSQTHKSGTIRGMHFQHAPDCEKKIVSCFRGEVLDVAVDIRKGSPTFLQWHGEILSADNHRSLLISEGFAHGFQTLSADCELLYFNSARYSKQNEGELNAFDPKLSIDWPADLTDMSERDRNAALINDTFAGITP